MFCLCVRHLSVVEGLGGLRGPLVEWLLLADRPTQWPGAPGRRGHWSTVVTSYVQYVQYVQSVQCVQWPGAPGGGGTRAV